MGYIGIDGSKNLSTFEKGKLAELYFESECIKRGIDLLKPIMPDRRYDYVALTGNSFRRIQVKWAAGGASNGCIELNLSRPRGNRRKERPQDTVVYNQTEVDLVAAYLPSIKQFVILGPDLFHQKRGLSLRINSTKNGQRIGVRMAIDHLWTNQLVP